MVSDPKYVISPVRLIFNIVKYALKTTKPVKRSAFTYGELSPSRFDIAKQRYGGSFTTEEVEDVKSFCNVLLIIISLFGFALQASTVKLSSSYLINKTNETLNFMENLIIVFPTTTVYIAVSVFIPVFQFVLVPFCQRRYFPNILQRLYIGIAIVLLQSIILLILSVILSLTKDKSDNICESFSLAISFPIYIFLIPQILAGLSTALILTSGFEFILAQAPRSMQGLLIGIWFMESAITTINTALNISSIPCHWLYYAVIVGLVCLSVLLYSISAYKYNYRQRNEKSEINERIIITQYTERQLNRQESETNNDSSEFVVTSI